jgi:hypothetical protein
MTAAWVEKCVLQVMNIYVGSIKYMYSIERCVVALCYKYHNITQKYNIINIASYFITTERKRPDFHILEENYSALCYFLRSTRQEQDGGTKLFDSNTQ